MNNTKTDICKNKVEEILKRVQRELDNEDFQQALELLNDYFSSKTEKEKGLLCIEIMAARENVKELVFRTLKLLYKYEPDLKYAEKSELYDGK